MLSGAVETKHSLAAVIDDRDLKWVRGMVVKKGEIILWRRKVKWTFFTDLSQSNKSNLI